MPNKVAPHGAEHIQEQVLFLDVFSVRQGALRVRILLYFAFFLCFFGFYRSVGAILNYNAIDADARDMITNMRLFLTG